MIAQTPPAIGNQIVVVDLSDENGKCELMKSSWQNPISAKVAMQTVATMAAHLSSRARIAVICPYRAQAKMLRQWVQQEHKVKSGIFWDATVEVGTVHQFQGSEADAVVFDLVDGVGRRNLGKLLRGDTGTRLLNVAISRAKGKLIVIADRKWCREANVTRDNDLLANLIFGECPVVTPNVLKSIKIRSIAQC